eukprot:2083-Heterococcus_DN1.PRE.1
MLCKQLTTDLTLLAACAGVNFMEKTITLRNTEITFSIWDLGGQREFLSMLPLVCNDAVATFFMFDLSRKSTLNSVKVSSASYNCTAYTDGCGRGAISEIRRRLSRTAVCSNSSKCTIKTALVVAIALLFCCSSKLYCCHIEQLLRALAAANNSTTCKTQQFYC